MERLSVKLVGLGIIVLLLTSCGRHTDDEVDRAQPKYVPKLIFDRPLTPRLTGARVRIDGGHKWFSESAANAAISELISPLTIDGNSARVQLVPVDTPRLRPLAWRLMRQRRSRARSHEQDRDSASRQSSLLTHAFHVLVLYEARVYSRTIWGLVHIEAASDSTPPGVDADWYVAGLYDMDYTPAALYSVRPTNATVLEFLDTEAHNSPVSLRDNPVFVGVSNSIDRDAWRDEIGGPVPKLW